MTGHGEQDRLRERLLAVSALVGAPITISEGMEWLVTSDGIQVGLGYYAARGHSDQEAVALALLQLWESVRFFQQARDRSLRRDSLARQKPELVPLLDTILRLQAAAELLTALPAMRDDLAAAATRTLPEQLTEQPRHLQWLAVLLHSGLTWRVQQEVAPEVQSEWRQLLKLGGAHTDPVLRVMAPDPARSALQRFERALALLLPPYERLLVQDLADVGLSGVSGQRSPENNNEGSGLLETGDGHDTEHDGTNQPGEGETDANTTTKPDPTSDVARHGEGQERSEGSDLFAAEQAGFVTAFLSTPLPSEQALLEAGLSVSQDARATGSSDQTRSLGDAASAVQGATGTHNYRRRVSELSAAIAEMREVWATVIAERVTLRAVRDRLPQQEGDSLHTNALADVIAQVHGGIKHPRAFVRRRLRPKRAHRSGSTDYVLLIDRSASMQGPPAEAAADAALVMLEGLAGAERDIAFAEVSAGIDLDINIRTSLITFNAEIETVKPLSRGLDDGVRQRMVSAIRNTRGSTNDSAALAEAAFQLGLQRPLANHDGATDAPARRRIVIFVGDGGSNDPVSAAHQLRRLHAAGVHVYGVGIRSDEVLQRFAPSSRRIDDPRELPGALQSIIEHAQVAWSEQSSGSGSETWQQTEASRWN